MSETNVEKMTFDLPVELRDRAHAYAKRSGVAASSVAKLALSEYLEAHGA